MSEEKRENPFTSPIKTIAGKIVAIRWCMPFLPQVIQLLVQSIIIIILSLLYCTIGIVFNCYSVFCSLLSDTRAEFKNSDLVGKSAYALMAGVYLLLAAPCFLIVMPFMVLGMFWERMSWFGLALYVLIITIVVLIVFQYDSIVAYYLAVFTSR